MILDSKMEDNLDVEELGDKCAMRLGAVQCTNAILIVLTHVEEVVEEDSKTTKMVAIAGSTEAEVQDVATVAAEEDTKIATVAAVAVAVAAVATNAKDVQHQVNSATDLALQNS